MRILIVHPRMSIKGGGERVALHSILAGLRSGHSVSLVSEEFDTADFEDFFGCKGLFDDVNLIKYPRFKPIVGNRILLYQRLTYHQMHLRRVLSNAGRFDLAMGTQDIGYVPNLKDPILQYCYFPEYFTHLESSPSSKTWRLYYWPASRFYKNRVRRVGQLLAVSDYSREFVRQKWGRESETLYPPCPTETYSSLNEPKENLVVTIGRIVPEKRMHLFMEIARRLKDYRFVVIGSRSESGLAYFESLKKSAPSNLDFVLSPLRKVRELLARSKVYVHCALNEHFGITIVEAMSARCVPVVHDSGGPREIIDETVGFRWEEIDKAVEQIASLMTDEDLCEKLAAAASRRALDYSPATFESKLTRIFATYNSRNK